LKTTVYYSVRNLGDGSAYPTFFESEELARIDQDYLDEGWGESCTGSLTIKHTGKISFEGVETLKDCITELEAEINEDWFTKGEQDQMKKKLAELKKLK